MTEEKIASLRDAFKQTEAIWALEGFEPSLQSRAINAAVLSGRVDLLQVAPEMRDYAMQHKTTDGFIESREWAVKGDYFLVAYQKDNGRWYWQICQTSTGDVLENDHHGSATEQECRDSGAQFIGDWFAGYMTPKQSDMPHTSEQWIQGLPDACKRLNSDEVYRKAISRRAF